MKKLAILALQRPFAASSFSTVVSLVAGAAAIIMADFGQPLWMFLPLFLWLGTIGLPATVGVLLVATAWGRLPFLMGLGPFLLCASIVAFGLETISFHFFSRLFSRSDV